MSTTAHVQFIKQCEHCYREYAIEKINISGYKGGFDAVDVPEGTEKIVIFCNEYWSREEYGKSFPCLKKHLENLDKEDTSSSSDEESSSSDEES